MRLAVVLLAALVAGAAPAEAAFTFAPKRAAKAAKRCAPKRCAKGWRAAPPRAAPPVAAPAPGAEPLVPLAGPQQPPPAGEPAPTAPAAGPAAPACDPSPWLGVIAEDVDGFRLRVTRQCVPAGNVLFNFRNNDLSPHNLWAEGVSPARAERQVVETTPGETVVNRGAELGAGTWRLFCALPGHEAMSRLVTVTPAA